MVIDEPVKDNSQCLIAPGAHKLLDALESIRSGQTEAIVDPGEVPEVKDVVELGWRGRQISYNKSEARNTWTIQLMCTCFINSDIL